MDVTFRNVDSESFRRFKARCAENDLPMGSALSFAMREWLSRWEPEERNHVAQEASLRGEPLQIHRVSQPDLHKLHDLSGHFAAFSAPKQRKRKRQ